VTRLKITWVYDRGCFSLWEKGVGYSADTMGLADRVEGERRV